MSNSFQNKERKYVEVIVQYNQKQFVAKDISELSCFLGVTKSTLYSRLNGRIKTPIKREWYIVGYVDNRLTTRSLTHLPLKNADIDLQNLYDTFCWKTR